MSTAVSVVHSPRGSAVTRTAIALAATRGVTMDAAGYAGARWGTNSAPALAMRAAVALAEVARLTAAQRRRGGRYARGVPRP